MIARPRSQQAEGLQEVLHTRKHRHAHSKP